MSLKAAKRPKKLLVEKVFACVCAPVIVGLELVWLNRAHTNEGIHHHRSGELSATIGRFSDRVVASTQMSLFTARHIARLRPTVIGWAEKPTEYSHLHLKWKVVN